MAGELYYPKVYSNMMLITFVTDIKLSQKSDHR